MDSDTVPDASMHGLGLMHYKWTHTRQMINIREGESEVWRYTVWACDKTLLLNIVINGVTLPEA